MNSEMAYWYSKAACDSSPFKVVHQKQTNPADFVHLSSNSYIDGI